MHSTSSTDKVKQSGSAGAGGCVIGGAAAVERKSSHSAFMV